MHVFKMQIFHSQPQQKCHLWVFVSIRDNSSSCWTLVWPPPCQSYGTGHCQSSDCFTARRKKGLRLSSSRSLLVFSVGYFCSTFKHLKVDYIFARTTCVWFCFMFTQSNKARCVCAVFIPTEGHFLATNFVYFFFVYGNWHTLIHILKLADECISGELLTARLTLTAFIRVNCWS